jgi:uncharacterized protein
VYVRGSVPLGEPRDFVSDLDTFAVVTGPAPPAVPWAAEHSREVARRWPFVAGVEASVHRLDVAVASRPVAAMIKLVGACVHGEDLAPRIRGFRPGIELVFHAWDLPRDTAWARRLLASASNPGLVDETCVWISKRLVRSGFELVMERAGCYTRDLAACRDLFAAYHPQQAAVMDEALSLALSTRGDHERCLRVLDQLGDWLHEAVCAEYGAARIQQLLTSPSEEAAHLRCGLGTHSDRA